MTGLLLALQVFTAAADGQRYGTAPLLHAAVKSVASVTAYRGLRAVGASRPVSAVLATAGVLLAAKGVELARGHQLGPLDTLHDGLWHSVPILAVTLRGRPRLAVLSVGVGLALATCHRASPRWC